MIDKKKQILDILSTLSLLNSESFSKLNSFYAKGKILNSNNSPLLFLIDVLKSVIGFDKLKEEILTFISVNILTLESSLKILLRKFLKEHYSCSSNAVLNPDLINIGINFSISSIDIASLLKINPLSNEGELLYGNIQNDLNSAIYNSIQTPNLSVNYKNLLILTYTKTGIVNGKVKTDVLNVKIFNSYTNKKVTIFINDLLNSIIFFTFLNVINKVFDVMFGSFSSLRTINDIKKEKEVENIINKIIDYRQDYYNNSYYSFDNIKLNEIYPAIYNISNQQRNIGNCSGVITQIDNQNIYSLNNLTPSGILINNEAVILTQFNLISKDIENSFNDINKPSSIFDFYLTFYKTLIYSVFINLFSPKFIILITIYAKAVRSNTVFSNYKEFIIENMEFIKKIMYNLIIPFFINFLQTVLKKYVTELLAKEKIKKIKEKFDLYKLQINSLR